MSKKLDTLTKAVFYAEQKPEKLAEILAGNISDVATSVGISGPAKIIIPSGNIENTATYTASVLSQFGDAMEGAPVLTLKENVTGVSIADGVVSVAKTASAGTIYVVATADSLSAEYSVKLVAEA